MPELPEVESVKRGLAKELALPLVVTDVELRRPDLRFPFPRTLRAHLRGARLESFQRRGKYILFRFDRGVLLTHLGMTGSWRLQSSRDPLELHDHVVLTFRKSGRSALVYNDPRRFGFFDWIDRDQSLEANRFLKLLGPEPLSSDFSPGVLKSKLKARSAAVKVLLMDAKVVVGVGNIYASEALFRAGVRPSALGKRITSAQCERIVESVKAVLQEAIESGGSTIRTYRGADGKAGDFQSRHFVYERKNEPCRVCGTKIKHIVQAGRSTYYCPTCQR
ncbi:MAG: bifunctional DNA-formamidopyrimidine glycosylase/DNA-(apurinic or apyrimidinic site) lyase [Bdellovibrionales bacterium]|nr:bifunctional DNA-formamidopyrimidine glycosylase/DNA-(apurinic or apyrimidinic site) lyase [Bdellovibrionales bacterium]